MTSFLAGLIIGIIVGSIATYLINRQSPEPNERSGGGTGNRNSNPEVN